MRTDIIQLRQKASQARDFINYSIDVYNHIGLPVPQHIHETLQLLDTVEPYLYRGDTLGQIQFAPLIWGGMALSALVTVVVGIYEKATSDKAQAALELEKLELIKQGVIPADSLDQTKKDTLGDTLDKIRSLLLISVAIIAVVSITNLFKH
jgi:hypothetical protein